MDGRVSIFFMSSSFSYFHGILFCFSDLKLYASVLVCVMCARTIRPQKMVLGSQGSRELLDTEAGKGT